MTIDWTRVEHLSWAPDGNAGLGGALLEAFHALDRQFAGWAKEAGADHYRFSDLIPIDALRRIGYLGSFPHLVTFAAPLADDDTQRSAFVAEERAGRSGPVDSSLLAPAAHVLAPAACFPVYSLLQGCELARSKVVTVCGTCYRNESSYAPLQRQRSFTMREIVCIGSGDEVESFLAGMATRSERFANALGLSVAWTQATDPFFDPVGDPRHLAQDLEPLKTELHYRGALALCSANMHGNFFTEAHAIRRDGGDAMSGCIAYGLERWLYALLDTYGPDCRDWPALDTGV